MESTVTVGEPTVNGGGVVTEVILDESAGFVAASCPPVLAALPFIVGSVVVAAICSPI